MNNLRNDLDKLQKLYDHKCEQLQKAEAFPNTCLYMVLQAEAASLRQEIERF